MSGRIFSDSLPFPLPLLRSFSSPLLSALLLFLFLSPPLPLFGLNLSFLSPGLFCPLALGLPAG